MSSDNRSKKILIIEDEKSISDIIKYNLEKEGYEITAAYDGGEGLAKALAGNFDLILLDVMLPVTDGFEVCKRVREKSSVPIIMLTAKEEVNIRSLPDTNSERVGALVAGDQLEIVAIEDGWVTVKFEDMLAYVNADYVECTIFDE